MSGAEGAATPGAFDWNIVDVVAGAVQNEGQRVAVQYVAVGCGCLGVWADDVLVGYSKMCYHHECFKLLARVAQSKN